MHYLPFLGPKAIPPQTPSILGSEPSESNRNLAQFVPSDLEANTVVESQEIKAEVIGEKAKKPGWKEWTIGKIAQSAFTGFDPNEAIADTLKELTAYPESKAIVKRIQNEFVPQLLQVAEQQIPLIMRPIFVQNKDKISQCFEANLLMLFARLASKSLRHRQTVTEDVQLSIFRFLLSEANSSIEQIQAELSTIQKAIDKNNEALNNTKITQTERETLVSQLGKLHRAKSALFENIATKLLDIAFPNGPKDILLPNFKGSRLSFLVSFIPSLLDYVINNYAKPKLTQMMLAYASKIQTAVIASEDNEAKIKRLNGDALFLLIDQLTEFSEKYAGKLIIKEGEQADPLLKDLGTLANNKNWLDLFGKLNDLGKPVLLHIFANLLSHAREENENKASHPLTCILETYLEKALTFFDDNRDALKAAYDDYQVKANAINLIASNNHQEEQLKEAFEPFRTLLAPLVRSIQENAGLDADGLETILPMYSDQVVFKIREAFTKVLFKYYDTIIAPQTVVSELNPALRPTVEEFQSSLDKAVGHLIPLIQIALQNPQSGAAKILENLLKQLTKMDASPIDGKLLEMPIQELSASPLFKKILMQAWLSKRSEVINLLVNLVVSAESQKTNKAHSLSGIERLPSIGKEVAKKAIDAISKAGKSKSLHAGALINSKLADDNLTPEEETFLELQVNQFCANLKTSPEIREIIESLISMVVTKGLINLAAEGPSDGDALSNAMLQLRKIVGNQLIDNEELLDKLDQHKLTLKEIARIEQKIKKLKRKINKAKQTIKKTTSELQKQELKDLINSIQTNIEILSNYKKECTDSIDESRLLKEFQPLAFVIMEAMGFGNPAVLPHPALWSLLTENVIPSLALKSYLEFSKNFRKKKNKIDSLEAHYANQQFNLAEAAKDFAAFAMLKLDNKLVVNTNELANQAAAELGIVTDEADPKETNGLPSNEPAVKGNRNTGNIGRFGLNGMEFLMPVVQQEIYSQLIEFFDNLAKNVQTIETNNPDVMLETILDLSRLLTQHAQIITNPRILAEKHSALQTVEGHKNFHRNLTLWLLKLGGKTRPEDLTIPFKDLISKEEAWKLITEEIGPKVLELALKELGSEVILDKIVKKLLFTINESLLENAATVSATPSTPGDAAMQKKLTYMINALCKALPPTTVTNWLPTLTALPLVGKMPAAQLEKVIKRFAKEQPLSKLIAQGLVKGSENVKIMLPATPEEIKINETEAAKLAADNKAAIEKDLPAEILENARKKKIMEWLDHSLLGKLFGWLIRPIVNFIFRKMARSAAKNAPLVRAKIYDPVNVDLGYRGLDALTNRYQIPDPVI